MLAAAGWDGAGPEQAVRAAAAMTVAVMAAMLAATGLLAVTAFLVVPLSIVRRGIRMGRIVTSLPWRPLSAIYSLSAPRLYPASATVSGISGHPATGAMEHGCVSFGGGSGGEGVAAGVGAFVFALEVPGPVGVPVAVGEQGAEFEDGLGGVDAPAGAGDVHAVFDQVAAGAFYDAGGDGPAGGQGGGVVQVRGLGLQVCRGLVHGGAPGLAQARGGAAQGGGHGGGAGWAGGQELGGAGADPGPGVGAGLGEQAPGGVPQVLGDVVEVG